MSQGIYSGLGQAVDGFLATYVLNVSSTIALGITPIVASGITLWAILFGYAVSRGEVDEPFNIFAWKVTQISIILGFALSGGIYQREIVETVYALQNGLAKLVTPNSGIVSATGNNICELIDSLDEKTADMGLFILMRGASKLPIGGWLDLVAGLLVLFANTVLIVMCGGFVLMAKVAMAFVLGTGPMFIACLAFPPVRKFFDAWFGKLMTYLLMVVVLAFAVGLSISIADSYLQHALSANAEIADPVNQIKEAFALFALYITLCIFVYQAPQIAAGLSGGTALTGGGLLQRAFNSQRGVSQSSKAHDSPSPRGGDSIGPGNSGPSPGRSEGNSVSGTSKKIPAYKRAAHNRYNRK